MQKKIIALAVAALASSAAFAQSNVTIYGVADMFVMHASGSGVKGTNAVESGGLAGSRLGFKGSEDLGNGLKAIFTLEYALNMDNNNGVGAVDTPWSGTAARQQFVGLSSDKAGTVVAGRLQTAGYDFACAYNPLAGGAFATNDKLKGSSLVNCGSSGRADNAIAYISPTFGGVSVALNHARLTENANNQTVPTGYAAGDMLKKDNVAYLGSVNYKLGDLSASAIYTRITGANTVQNDAIREWGLGASYDFKVVKLFAMYENTKSQNGTPSNTGLADKKWQVGASVPVTANGTVAASYAHLKQASTTADDNTKAFGLAYIHALSKRTKLYAGYNRVDNDGVGQRSVTNITTSTALGTNANDNFVVPTAGGNASLWGVGVNHAF